MAMGFVILLIVNLPSTAEILSFLKIIFSDLKLAVGYWLVANKSSA